MGAVIHPPLIFAGKEEIGKHCDFVLIITEAARKFLDKGRTAILPSFRFPESFQSWMDAENILLDRGPPVKMRANPSTRPFIFPCPTTSKSKRIYSIGISSL
jgi:hypothetical protein